MANKNCKNLGEYMRKGGPGRPKGSSGRTKALAVLDGVIGKASNRKVLRESLQQRFDEAPDKFWKEYVVPLLPKEMQIDVNAMINGRIELKWDENASSDDPPAGDASEAGEHIPESEPV